MHFLFLQEERLECTQLDRFGRTDKSLTWRGVYARANAFLRCENLDVPKMDAVAATQPKDDDQWADDSFAALE